MTVDSMVRILFYQGSDQQLISKIEVATVVIAFVSKNGQPTKSEIQAKWSITKDEPEQEENGQMASSIVVQTQPKSLLTVLKMEAAAWSLIACHHPHL